MRNMVNIAILLCISLFIGMDNVCAKCDDEEKIVSLIEKIDTSDLKGKISTINELSYYNSHPYQIIYVYQKLLSDNNPALRSEILASLFGFGDAINEIIPQLVSAADYESDEYKVTLLTLIGSESVCCKEALDFLIASLKSQNSFIHRRAWETLATLNNLAASHATEIGYIVSTSPYNERHYTILKDISRSAYRKVMLVRIRALVGSEFQMVTLSRLKSLITKLNNDDFEIRNEATVNLIRTDKVYATFLENEANKTIYPEARYRLFYIVSAILDN